MGWRVARNTISKTRDHSALHQVAGVRFDHQPYLATLGKALGLSEPVVRERARRNEFAALGIRVLQLGAQYRVPTADVLRFLGVDGPQPRAEREAS